MYKYQNKFVFFVNLIIFASFVAPNPNDTITTNISRGYLKSFPTEKLPKIVNKRGGISAKLNLVQLKKSTRRKVVLNSIFNTENIKKRLASQPDLLNHHAWSDLKLFYGTTSSPAHHLLSRINRTNTVLGEAVLATLLVTPTNDIDLLRQRQHMIKVLIDDPVTCQKIKKIVCNYQKSESSLLSFWTITDPLYTKEYTNYMYIRFFSNNEQLNKSAGKLRPRIFWRNYRDIYSKYTNHFLIGAFTCEGISMASKFNDKSSSSDRLNVYADLYPLFVPGYSIVHAIQGNNQATKKSVLPFIGAAITNGTAVWSWYRGVKNYKEYSSVFRNLASRMQDVQMFIKAAINLSETVSKAPALEAAYGPYLVALRGLINQQDKRSELALLIHNLKNMSFTNWSYAFGDGAKLLATFKLFIANKDAFTSAMYDMGKVDAFMGIAMLMQEAAAYSDTYMYTFTTLLGRAEKSKPYIMVKDMWNPLLDAKEVVGNDIVMGVDGTRNMILTGPNAGGKSTFLTGIAISLLLNQTFGITPSKEAEITPFNKISTYIDVGDEIATGQSLFMVEVQRAKDHLAMLEKLEDDEFSFSIFDEPLGGTNAKEAVATAYSILSYMGKYSNALNIVATHYPSIMRLEKDAPGKGFKNYKVFINKEGKGKKIEYTYKIVPGRSQQAIAIDILEQKGYDQIILKQARDMITNPHKYVDDFK